MVWKAYFDKLLRAERRWDRKGLHVDRIIFACLKGKNLFSWRGSRDRKRERERKVSVTCSVF